MFIFIIVTQRFLYLQLRGSNFFFHQIISGTCASNALDSITSTDLCAVAALDEFRNSHDHDEDGHLPVEIDNECILQSRHDIASSHVPDYLKASKKCTPKTPCFCTSSHYIQHNNTQTHRSLTQDSGKFSVTWNLDLGGKEFLLESSFLKAAFEQSVKDYINNDILCSDDLNVKGAEFFGVEIVGETNKQTKKWKAVSGNGKCKGDIKKCKVPIRAKRQEVAEDDAFDDDEFDDDGSSNKHQNLVMAARAKDGFCDIFLTSTIFDAFRERLLMAAYFNYDIDVDVINDLEGNLNLKYDVTFHPEKAHGLDEIEEVALDAADPVQINPTCQDATQCLTQRGIMKEIFQYFNLAWDDNKHECLYEGINCNEEDLVTHIWMGKSQYIFI